ncbi:MULTISPECIES: hypothetical protein [unclassified Flavobacterium]|jgi:hypothetical protein|uniref:hypothetical protein n=1 Tax=unclassified Flavobacterium TaxID=196869 RepID=UPI0025BA0929|nr:MULTISPECIES: hypothetical protein [unclassified Flavobacterium]
MAYGSFRNSNINLSVYSTAEKLLAKNIDAEAALTISSGMPTGKLVGNPLSKTTDSMFHFPDAHVILLFGNLY